MNSEKQKNIRNVPMEKKVFRAMMNLLIAVILVLSAVVFIQLVNMRKDIAETSSGTGEKIEEISSNAVENIMTESLLKLTTQKAADADSEFTELGKIIAIMAESAENIYEDPSEYGSVTVEIPKKENDGILTVQATYSAAADISAPALQREQGLLGNLSGLLLSVYESSGQIASVYYATESGIMIQADKLSGSQFDGDGNILPFETKERPWYIGAKETGNLFFTEATRNIDTGEYAIMCSAPIYRDSEFMGVAAGGMYLSDLSGTVRSAVLDSSGSACMIDGEGNIIFSTRTDGELSAGKNELKNILSNSNPDLQNFAENAISGSSIISLIEIDGVKNYLSCAPMETVGWSLISVLPEEVVSSPTLELTDELGRKNDEMISRTDNRFLRVAIYLLIGVAILAILAMVVSKKLSARLMVPIVRLTEKVGNIDGDKLDFNCDEKTGDEIDVLAESFKNMTNKIEKYICEITAITAEKERISAELSVASSIQADMLPCIFPPFPKRDKFDIFASMTPAKEVAGIFTISFCWTTTTLRWLLRTCQGKAFPLRFLW